MAADGSVDFTVRLIDQITGPARAGKKALQQLEGAFKATKRTMEAPAARRSPLSQFDRNAAAARRSQAADFAKQQQRLVRANAIASKKMAADRQKLKDMNLFGAVSSGAGFGMGALALGATAAAATAAAVAVGLVAFKFLEAATNAGRFRQRSLFALTQLTGSAGVAQVQFDSLRREAQTLGLDVEDTQLQFQKLLAAQFSIAKSKELLRMGADLRTIGNDAEGVKGALLAITQIKSKGRLQAEELLQLQERNISSELVYKALEKRLGKTREQLLKLQKAGQIKGDDAIEAILSAVKAKTGTKVAGEAGKKFAETTLDGMVGKFKAGWQNMWIDMGRLVLPQVERVAKLIGGSLGKLMDNPRFGELGDRMLTGLTKFVDWLEVNWPTVDKFLNVGMHLITAAFYASVAAIKLVANNWDIIGPIVQAVGISFGVVVGIVVALTAAVVGLIAIGHAFAAAAMYVYFEVPKLIGEAMGNMAKRALDWGANLVGGFIGGIMAQIPYLLAVVQSMAVLIEATLRSALQMHSPSVKGVDIGANFGESIGLGLQGSEQVIRAASGRLGGAVGGGAVDGGPGAGAARLTGGINVVVNGAQVGDNPQALGELVARITRNEIRKFFAEAST